MITVYEKPNCMQCRLTQKFLTQHDAEYVVEQMNDEALALAADAGITAAPIVTLGDWIVGGFVPDVLKEMIDTQKKVA